MPILKSTKKTKDISISAKFPESLKQEVDAYIAFAELGSMNEFLIKAAEYVLAKDKEWKKKRE